MEQQLHLIIDAKANNAETQTIKTFLRNKKIIHSNIKQPDSKTHKNNNIKAV